MIDVVVTTKESAKDILTEKTKAEISKNMAKASLIELKRKAKNFTSEERIVVLRYATNKELIGEVLRRLDKLTKFVAGLRGLMKLNFSDQDDCDWADDLDSVIGSLQEMDYERE